MNFGEVCNGGDKVIMMAIEQVKAKSLIFDRELGETTEQYLKRKSKESWKRRIKSIMSIN